MNPFLNQLFLFISLLLTLSLSSTLLEEYHKNIFISYLQSIIGNDSTSAIHKLKLENFTQIIRLSKDQYKSNEVKSKYKLASSTTTTTLPVVQMHGMGDFAKDPFGMVPLAHAISDYLDGAYVLNVQIGESCIEDILNGFIMNLNDQVDYFANSVRNDINLINGFNAIGYSQGNLVVRGYIERYNNPPVMNFISMHGPLAGVGGFPGCSMDNMFCRAFAALLGTVAYNPMIQDHLAQANYFRDPLRINDYLNGDLFLVDVNNELDTTNKTYNYNWMNLNSICLVKALNDTVVIPNDSEWFGFFKDGSYNNIWLFNETPWYQDNLFGLKNLDLKNKVYFNTTDGNHLDFSTDYLLDLVGIYFV